MDARPTPQAANEIANIAIDAPALREALIDWGTEHFRPFPWRSTQDPYRILIAEVMLHRTQAQQVVPVYERFISRYPDVAALARATRDELHRILHSLGLRWRIDLMYAMATDLSSRFGGRVPFSKSDLQTLPGVSDYIASAVRCFAWDEPDPIVDTNTVRVVARLSGLTIRDSLRRNREFRSILARLIDPASPRRYNFALLDLAEAVCTKRTVPSCRACPLIRWCTYGSALIQADPHCTVRQ